MATMSERTFTVLALLALTLFIILPARALQLRAQDIPAYHWPTTTTVLVRSAPCEDISPDC